MNVQLLTRFAEVLVPLFVTVGPLTVVPMYLSMTEGMSLPQARQLAWRGIITAMSIATGVVLIGQVLFRFLGITVDDLRIAGGLILLTIATYDLVLTREKRKQTEIESDAGIVPLGTPLIVGPATMTACIVLADTHGRVIVLVSLLLVLALTLGLLLQAHWLNRWLGPAVTKAFSKVMSLFLAAIAVAMLRTGISAFVHLQP